MTFDPALLRMNSAIEEGTPWPRPQCPECFQGHLRFAEPVEVEDGLSKLYRDDDDWEPDWISGVFSAVASCENPECQKAAIAIGAYRVSYSRERPMHAYQGIDYSSFYTIRQIDPPLLLMRLPKSAPESVHDGVARASAVILADPGLAATALLLAVEQFLTSEGIPAAGPSGGFINADQRIKEWRKTGSGRDRIADLLLAVKWIGNAGTHHLSTLTTKEVLDGVEFLDEAFHALFVGPDVDARAKAVNDARGPVPSTEP